MNSYDSFEKGFLADLAKPGREPEQHYRPYQIARQYGIPEAHVRELLIQWARARLISVSHWDGSRARPWSEWSTPDAMFSDTADGGCVRVKLLAAGAALVQDLPAKPIGFVPGAS